MGKQGERKTLQVRCSPDMVRELDQFARATNSDRKDAANYLIGQFILNPINHDPLDSIELRKPVSDSIMVTMEAEDEQFIRDFAADNFMSVAAVIRLALYNGLWEH